MLYNLEPNDTIVLNNHLLKVVNSLETSQTTTSWEDVEIAKQIGTSFMWIVGICIAGYIILTTIKLLFARASERRKRRWEDREKDNKRNAELKERKLNLLKEFCYDEIKASDGNKDKKLKAYNSEEVTKYLDELNS